MQKLQVISQIQLGKKTESISREKRTMLSNYSSIHSPNHSSYSPRKKSISMIQLPVLRRRKGKISLETSDLSISDRPKILDGGSRLRDLLEAISPRRGGFDAISPRRFGIKKQKVDPKPSETSLKPEDFSEEFEPVISDESVEEVEKQKLTQMKEDLEKTLNDDSNKESCAFHEITLSIEMDSETEISMVVKYQDIEAPHFHSLILWQLLQLKREYHAYINVEIQE